MKCTTCHATVRCRDCGAKVNSSQTMHYRRRKRKHLCARCPNKLSSRDILLEHVHCFDCRVTQAERSRARHRKFGRKDRQREAAA